MLTKLYSKLEEEKEKSIEEQRKGLSLAPIFAKPRPLWMAPVFSAFFGDLFIQNSTLEVSLLGVNLFSFNFNGCILFTAYRVLPI